MGRGPDAGTAVFPLQPGSTREKRGESKEMEF